MRRQDSGAYKGDAAEDVENLATKGWEGVVLEQGIYAGLLYFYSQREVNDRDHASTSPADAFLEQLLDLSRISTSPKPEQLAWRQPLASLKYLAGVCGDLHRTLFVKTMWEQVLTYVRYGAKSLKKAGVEGKA